MENGSPGDWRKPVSEPINPDDDYTAVVRVDEDLEPGKAYEIRAGWILESDWDKGGQQLAEDDWPSENIDSGQFSTAPDDESKPCHFVVGSCRNLGDCLNLLGLLPVKKPSLLAEQAFETLLGWLKDENPPRFIMMTGDQVYADKIGAGMIPRLPKSFEGYAARYRKAYGTPIYRQALARLPVYMMMDDHEIENNWAWSNYLENKDIQDVKKFKFRTFKDGIRAYEVYQASHSPLRQKKPDEFGRRYAHYWYTFDHGCAAFFVMDVRGEQSKVGGTTVVEDPHRYEASWEYRDAEPRMISEKQKNALFDWLKKQPQDQVKFIVSPVPLFPDSTMNARRRLRKLNRGVISDCIQLGNRMFPGNSGIQRKT